MSDQGTEIFRGVDVIRDVGTAFLCLVGRKQVWVPLTEIRYGTDLTNHVTYLGQEGPHGAFNAIPTCAAFRAAVNAADLDYLVTAPFLNFIHPGDPIPSPEARWLRGEQAVQPILLEGPVTVWRVHGTLDPSACGPENVPLREIPDTPTS